VGQRRLSRCRRRWRLQRRLRTGVLRRSPASSSAAATAPSLGRLSLAVEAASRRRVRERARARFLCPRPLRIAEKHLSLAVVVRVREARRLTGQRRRGRSSSVVSGQRRRRFCSRSSSSTFGLRPRRTTATIATTAAVGKKEEEARTTDNEVTGRAATEEVDEKDYPRKTRISHLLPRGKGQCDI